MLNKNKIKKNIFQTFLLSCYNLFLSNTPPFFALTAKFYKYE